MRVKNLSATRRPKAGDDDDSSTTSVSSSTSASPPPRAALLQQQTQLLTTHKWISPTKPHDVQRSTRRACRDSTNSSSDIGSSSPTDPTDVHPIELSDAVQAQLFLHAATTATTTASTDMANTHVQLPAAAAAAHDARDHKQQQQQQQSPSALHTREQPPAASITWRSHVLPSLRDTIHVKIVEHLRALKPQAPESVLARLPGLATRMEETLLQRAASLDEYADVKTLVARLSAIQQSHTKKLLQQQQQQQQQSSCTSPVASPTVATTGLNSRAPLTEDQARFVFQCLQHWRQKLVTIYGIEPWAIVANAILAKVAVLAPATELELRTCGVQEAQIARFGASLLQELQLICGSTRHRATATPSTTTPSRRPPPPIAAAAASTASTARRKAAEPLARTQDMKKRKTSVLTPSAATASNSFIAPQSSPGRSGTMTTHNNTTAAPQPSVLFRPSGVDTLPTLLPTTTTTAATGKPLLPLPPTSYNPMPVHLSPGSTQQQPPSAFFATRLPSPHGAAAALLPATTASSGLATSTNNNNRMHLLAQGAGHVSKQQQQTTKTIDAYEKEVQSLRWLLQQTQHDKAQLEDEVQRLRRQLQQ